MNNIVIGFLINKNCNVFGEHVDYMDKKVLHLHKIYIFTYILCVNEYLLFYYDWNSTFPTITNPCWKVITPVIRIRHIFNQWFRIVWIRIIFIIDVFSLKTKIPPSFSTSKSKAFLFLQFLSKPLLKSAFCDYRNFRVFLWFLQSWNWFPLI